MQIFFLYYKFLEKIRNFLGRILGFGGGADSCISGELGVIQFIQRVCKNQKEIVIFDVGANVGAYTSLLLSKLQHMPLIIHVFEPSKSTISVCASNISSKIGDKINVGCLNSIGMNSLYVNNFALGRDDSVRKLYSNCHNSTMASLVKRDVSHLGINFDYVEDVKIMKLDDYVQKNNIASIDFIKIDVEGFEYDVLHGAKNALKNGIIKNIQFEFGECNIDTKVFFKDLYNLLTEYGFSMYRILPSGYLYKINGYNEHLECFVCANYFCTKERDI